MNREPTTSLAEGLIKSLVPSASTDALLCSNLRNWAIRELRNDAQGSHRREWQDVNKSIDGLTHSARVRVQDDLAEALEGVKGDLEGLRRRGGGREWDGDGGVTVTNLPQHIQFLLNLSNPPNAATHDFAEHYLTRQPYSGPTPDQVLYDEIMAPPFRGDHWGEGYDEEVQDGWSESESGSRSTRSSSEDEEVWTPSSTRIAKMAKGTAGEMREERMRDARAVLEKLGERAYWRKPGVEVEPVKAEVYGWKDISTGVASLNLSETLTPSHARLKLISAAQFQREMLFAFTGRPNLLVDFSDQGPYCSIISDHPYTPHYSKAALSGILARLSRKCAQLTQLRNFVRSPPSPTSATTTAFIEAVRSVLQDFATWVADLETTLIQGLDPASPDQTGVGTPLALLLAYDTHHADLIDYLTSSLPHTDSSVGLTNALHSLVASSCTSSPSTTDHLRRVFIDTCEPLWASLGRWLMAGMPIPSALLYDDIQAEATELDDEKPFHGEFFIRRDRDVSWADEDFWECAWVVDEWPVWLVSELKGRVVEAGKARGLLRGLSPEGAVGRGEWKSLSEVLGASGAQGDMASVVQAYLGPICDLAIFQMRSVLEDDCGLLAHLDAIEGTMYFRSWGVVDEWAQWLYAQVYSGKKTWADFQTLSNTYRETIRSHGEIWMNAPAIRLSLSSRLKGEIGAAAIGLIRMTYEVPFPLSQLFSPTSTELRSDVFTFLLQFGYARYFLHTVRTPHTRGLGRCKARRGMSREMRGVLDLKQRFLWVLDTIWIWIHDRVIGPQTAIFRERLVGTMSLGDTIQLELAHTRAIRKYCFLHDSTSIINGCVQDLLDLSQSLVSTFSAIQADLELAVKLSSPPAEGPVSHVTGRSRQRQHRPIPSSRRPETPSTDSEVESELDSDAADEIQEEGVEGEESVTVRLEPVSVQERLEGIGKRLMQVVRVFKEGVEELAGGENGVGDEVGQREEREVWGMLGFALEDWVDVDGDRDGI